MRVTAVLAPVAGVGLEVGGSQTAFVSRGFRSWGGSGGARSHPREVEGGDRAETRGTDHTRFNSRLHVTLRVGTARSSPS